MPSDLPSDNRLDLARELVREKGLSRQDLELLNEILNLGAGDLEPMLQPSPETPAIRPESPHLARLRRAFGLFLAFLNQFSDKRLGDVRQAMALVTQHCLANIEQMAQAAHRDILAQNQEPEWIIHLLDLIASLRTMATSLGSEEDGRYQEHWSGFLQDRREHFRTLFMTLGERSEGTELTAQLNQRMKILNQSLKTSTGRPLEAIRKLEVLLESALPEDTRLRAEPLLLVQHVISNLRMTLFRPLDRGIRWPAIENVRGSLQWLWNHLGWSLPRAEGGLLEHSLPREVRALLKQLRKDRPEAFRIVARALANHLALLSLVDHLEPAVNASIQERYAMVPTFYVIESELGRLAERVYHPRIAEQLPVGTEESLLLGAFLRQATLSLLQDQATIRGLLQQTLVNNDVDQLASTLDNLRALLLNHQRQLLGDLAGLFSAELRQRLFPDSPSLTEEGDRLRQRLHRLWDFLDPTFQQIQLHLELQDWPRLALTVAQAQNHVVGFRRSPEFLLIRSQDRQEFERITQAFVRILDGPQDVERALRESSELLGELLRFLDVFLLRINARVPLIRLDLTSAREAHQLCVKLLGMEPAASDRSRTTHRIIQTTKPLGVRDPQALGLLKRWVRAERNGKDAKTALDTLGSHLGHLSSRLEAALS
ncbi:MAG TPA: hypothetical protein PKL14_03170 [Holophaga sp.]|nr:hypothetical protein [Holophaga sp.]